jgi:hypothetical protein
VSIQMNAKSRYSFILALIGCMAVSTAQAIERHFPFVLASNATGSIADKLDTTKKALTKYGFEIAGEYSPFSGAHIIVVTNAELKEAAASHGRGGYIAAQRVSLTEMDGKTQVSFTNPYYMAKAYGIKSNLIATANAFKKALGVVKTFGPGRGLSTRKLKSYRYSWGMEEFDEPYDLKISDTNNEDLLATIEKNLDAKVAGATKVYRIDIPGTDQTLFGVSMKSADGSSNFQDEGYLMNIIDHKPLRSTAHLPYEILVVGDTAESLHARYRIALNFPDLSMLTEKGGHTFLNIMAAPDAIQEALIAVTGGEESEDDF